MTPDGQSANSQVFSQLPVAYARHRLVYAPDGKAKDYCFLEVNRSFEQQTGLRAADIVGRCVSEVLPAILTDPFDWISRYGEMVQRKGHLSFDQLSQPLQRWYRVYAFTISSDEFATLFFDVTDVMGKNEEQKAISSVLNDIIFELDESYQVSQILLADEKLLFWPEKQIISRSITALLPDKLAAEMTAALEKARSSGRRQTLTYSSLRDREDAWYQATIVWLGNSRHPRYIVAITDVTEQVKTKQALQESERSKALLLSHLPGMAYRCRNDSTWTMLFVSDGSLALTGYPPDSLVLNRVQSYNNLIQPQYREPIRQEWQRVLAAKASFRYEYEITTAQGHRKWVLEMGQGVFGANDQVEALEGIIIDITQTKEHMSQIRYMNDFDFLTGLYNRRYFADYLAYADSEDQLPQSLIIADINGLRLVNNAYGQIEGDHLITEVVKILQKDCGEGDMLARTGGDEFSLFLIQADETAVQKRLKQIQSACRMHNMTHSRSGYSISLSLGCSTRSDLAISIAQLEKAAEENMYQSKLLEQKSSHSALLTSVMATLYERSQETEEHAKRMAELALLIGKALHLPQKNLDELALLAMLHDIGKVGISDRILNKPGKLDAEEWEIMQKHSEIGYRIAMSSPELESIAELILYHHERWDGSGYPEGLSGQTIPLLSRIISVVDAYDAMTEDRIYRMAMPPDDALAEIRLHAGSQFDPDISALFIRLMR